MSHDAELLRRYATTGDAEAFAELVQRNLPLVYRAAWRQLGGDVHLAKDAAQCAFTLLAANAKRLVGHATVVAWLHVATRNVVRDLRRAAARRERREREAVLMSTPQASDAEAPAWDQLRPVLDDTLSELSASDREAVMLRFFQDLSYAEIAGSLRVSEDAARMRVARALEKLRRRLMRRGVTSTCSLLGLVLAGESACASVPEGLVGAVTSGAMAGATTSAAGALGLVGFMSTLKTVGSGLAAAAAIGLAVWTHGERANWEERRDVLRDQIIFLREQVEAQKAATAEKAPPSSGAPGANRTVGATTTDPVAEGEAFMAAHSEVRAALIAYRRAWAAARYHVMYRELQLTPEQQAEFEEIMMAGRGIVFNGLNGAWKMSLVPLPRLASEEKENRLRALLGDGGYAIFREFEGSSLTSVASVAQALYDSEAPLTLEQARGLRRVLWDRAETAPRTEGILDLNSYWRDVLADAADFLSDPQLEALEILRVRYELSFAQERAAKAEIAEPSAGG